MVTREELFEAVWTEPMITLSSRYGVSGSYLARVCDSLNVYERIETSAGGDLTAAQSRIAVALKDLAVRPAISTVVRRAVMSRVAT